MALGTQLASRDDSSTSPLSTPAIIGIACGGGGLFLIAGILFTIYCVRQRRHQREDEWLQCRGAQYPEGPYQANPQQPSMYQTTNSTSFYTMDYKLDSPEVKSPETNRSWPVPSNPSEKSIEEMAAAMPIHPAYIPRVMVRGTGSTDPGSPAESIAVSTVSGVVYPMVSPQQRQSQQLALQILQQQQQEQEQQQRERDEQRQRKREQRRERRERQQREQEQELASSPPAVTSPPVSSPTPPTPPRRTSSSGSSLSEPLIIPNHARFKRASKRSRTSQASISTTTPSLTTPSALPTPASTAPSTSTTRTSFTTYGQQISSKSVSIPTGTMATTVLQTSPLLQIKPAVISPTPSQALSTISTTSNKLRSPPPLSSGKLRSPPPPLVTDFPSPPPGSGLGPGGYDESERDRSFRDRAAMLVHTVSLARPEENKKSTSRPAYQGKANPHPHPHPVDVFRPQSRQGRRGSDEEDSLW